MDGIGHPLARESLPPESAVTVTGRGQVASRSLSLTTGRQSRAERTRVASGSSTTSTKTASSGTSLSAGTRNQSFVRRVTSFLILPLERKTNQQLPSYCLLCIVFIVLQYTMFVIKK